MRRSNERPAKRAKSEALVWRRDPESERRARISALRELYYGLIRLDPSNTGSPYMRTGTNVYISLTRISNAYVLADLLEIIGYGKLARDLASFARGVEWKNSLASIGGKRPRNTTEPSWQKWRAMNKRIIAAIAEVGRGEDVREVAKRPYLKLYVSRVRLNPGGYEYGRIGRYWGGGEPLYYVGSDRIDDELMAQHLGGKYILGEHVRARSNEEARRKIADKYRIRYRK